MGQKPRRVRGAHAAKDSDYFLPRRVRGKKYFSACQCQRRARRNPLWQQNRQILCQDSYFSLSSLFSSDMKVLMSLNWR